jgi:hypothetical protein
MSGREGVNLLRGRCVGTAESLTATQAIYATIIVNRLSDFADATPPHRQNLLDVALFASDRLSETADYTDADELCQAQEGITPAKTTI